MCACGAPLRIHTTDSSTVQSSVESPSRVNALGAFHELRCEGSRGRLRFRRRRRVVVIAAMGVRQCRIAAVAERELEPGDLAAGAKVIVLVAPAGVVVAVAVDPLEVAPVDRDHCPHEGAIVGLRVEPVPDEPRRARHVRIVGPDRQIVDVVEAEIVGAIARDAESRVEQRAPVERQGAQLLDDVDRVVDRAIELVALEVAHHVRQEAHEVFGPVAVRNDDREAARVVGGVRRAEGAGARHANANRGRRASPSRRKARALVGRRRPRGGESSIPVRQSFRCAR